MIYTGYYFRTGSYRDAGLEVVSISRSEPKGVDVDRKIWQLCPDSRLLFEHKNGKETDEGYTRRYLAQLDALGIERIRELIGAHGKSVVLCCWESNGRFCHRHLLAEYLVKHGVMVREF